MESSVQDKEWTLGKNMGTLYVIVRINKLIKLKCPYVYTK